MKRQTFNILQLAVGMMLVFFAFLSQAFIVETVLENRSKTDSTISKNAGYYSQTMMYAAFILSNLLAPPIVEVLGLRLSLLIGSGAYTIYMSGFLFLNVYFLYASAIFEGLAAGILWTSVGHYMALNSNEKTIGRNSGMMWMVYMQSVVLGGIFLRIVFGNREDRDISMSTTRLIYGSFAGVALAGNIVLALLQKPEREIRSNESYTKELVHSIKMLGTIDMWLLAVPFGFSGVELSFWSGVYSTSLSFTKSFSINTNQLMAYNSICIGIGELIGGGAFGLFGYRTNKYGRYPIMWLGTIVGIVTYVMVWINLPPNSAFEETYKTATIAPSISIALICGVLLGFTDACINTQIYSLLTVKYEGRTKQAFALHKFFHAALTTVCMFYGSVFSLHIQLIILAVGSILSSMCFTIAEKRMTDLLGNEKMGL